MLVLGAGLALGLAVAVLPDFLWAPLAAAVFSAGLALTNTRGAVLLAVFLVPWQIYLGNWPDSTFTFRLIDFVVLAALVVSLLRHPRGGRLVFSLWLLPLIVLIGLGTLSGLLQNDLYAVGKFVVDWWPSLAFYWLMLIWAPRAWRSLLDAYLLSFALQAGLGLFQVLIGDLDVVRAALAHPAMLVFFEPDFLLERLAIGTFNFGWGGRAYAFGTYLNSAGLGVNLAAAGTAAWALALRARRLWASRYFYVAVLLYVTCALVLKRSGWVGMGLGFFAVLLLNLGPRRRDLQRVILVGLLACVVVLPIVAARWEWLLERATDQVGWEYSRERTWPVYLSLLLQRPVLGYGPDYPTGSVEIGLAAQYGYDYNYEFGLDNSYLYLALVAGLPGLAVFLVLAAQAFGRYRLSRQPDIRVLQQAAISGLLAYMIGGAFIVIFANLHVGGTFFLMLALACTGVNARLVGRRRG
ncbi:MAG: O-antigen ligase family protein [Anaerolineales bacterium]|nr:O-antigen ligase family protein [Anaerolineales bacterium]